MQVQKKRKTGGTHCLPNNSSYVFVENFIITIFYLLIGILLRRMPAFPKESGNVLNLFVIYVSLPALVLLKIPELSFSRKLLLPALMPWGMLFLSALVVFLLARALRWNREITGALLLLVPLGNTSFLGIPMVEAFFGSQAIPYAVLYDQLGSFLALSTYGSLIIALYGCSGRKPTLWEAWKKIITFPPFPALILAFSLRGFPYPHSIAILLKTLSATLVPIVMIAVGYQLTLRLQKDVMPPLGLGLFLKLIGMPLVALLFCKFFGLTGTAANVSVFEAAMPPMVSAGALAILAGISPSLTAAMVGLGIVFSFITLPLLFQLF